MTASYKIILFITLLHASVLVDATNLRLSSTSLSMSFLPDAGEATIRVPLKKREISSDEIIALQQQLITISEKTLRSSKAAKAEANSASKKSLKVSNTKKASEAPLVDEPVQDLPLKRYFNGVYTGLISIANSSNSFEVVFDTGIFVSKLSVYLPSLFIRKCKHVDQLETLHTELMYQTQTIRSP